MISYGIKWYCNICYFIVLHGIACHCIVQHGMMWHDMALHRMVFHGIDAVQINWSQIRTQLLAKNLISQFLEADLGGDRVHSICTRLLLLLTSFWTFLSFVLFCTFVVVDIIIKNMQAKFSFSRKKVVPQQHYFCQIQQKLPKVMLLRHDFFYFQWLHC